MERMRGGSFNRTVSIDPVLPEDMLQYILRIPRFDSAQIDNEVAVLGFIHGHTDIPAPEVIAFDET